MINKREYFNDFADSMRVQVVIMGCKKKKTNMTYTTQQQQRQTTSIRIQHIVQYFPIFLCKCNSCFLPNIFIPPCHFIAHTLLVVLIDSFIQFKSPYYKNINLKPVITELRTKNNGQFLRNLKLGMFVLFFKKNNIPKKYNFLGMFS